MKTIKVINRGGFGVVDEVMADDGSIVARKTFSPNPGIPPQEHDKLRQRFAREVQVQSLLPDKLFLPVLESNLTVESPWFTMPLAELTYKEQIEKDRLSGDISQEPLSDILNALEQLHDLGYVHRDLKPENVLLHNGKWKLSDFGLVMPALSTTTRLTSASSSWGTPEYAAPEQALDFRHVSAAADIYSFGCMLHDLVVGSARVPFQKHTCEGPLGIIIERCTEKEPDRRFRTVSGLRGVLLATLSEPDNRHGSPEATEWAQRLTNVQDWTAQTLAELVHFLRQSHGDLQVYSLLDEDTLTVLYELDGAYWEDLAASYCEWARGSFSFGFCDVIAGRLNCIFNLGSLSVKSEAAMSAADLGVSHNRYFVMQCAIHMCGPDLDDLTAQRIAIDIQANEYQHLFRQCVAALGWPMDHYHSRIAAALRE
ncbi:MAG: serine/threonine-protein kinase [Armatimonadota bacterium]